MPRISLVLHNIRSTHNVGAIFRTAEGLGVHEIICTGYTPYPVQSGDTRLPHISDKLTRQIHKTALGAETIVPFTYFESISDWFAINDVPVVALEQSSTSINIKVFSPPDNFCLLLGEEVHGIGPELLSKCDYTVEIPMRGTKESFNVSVATGIALYALTLT